jgi:hypothetical protein
VADPAGVGNGSIGRMNPPAADGALIITFPRAWTAAQRLEFMADVARALPRERWAHVGELMCTDSIDATAAEAELRQPRPAPPAAKRIARTARSRSGERAPAHSPHGPVAGPARAPSRVSQRPRLAHAARHQAGNAASAMRLRGSGLMHSETSRRGRVLYLGLAFLGLDVLPAACRPGCERCAPGSIPGTASA